MSASPGGRGARLALAVTTVAVAGLLVAFAVALRRPSGGPVPGQPAPDFALDTYDGEVIRLSDLRGRVVVVNFWASWCVTCAYEAADLEAIWRDYRDRGVTVLGVAYTDTRPAALAYLERHGVTYPNGPDRGGRVSSAYRLAGVPETVVVDPNGLVVGVPLRSRPGVPAAKIVGPVSDGGDVTPEDLRGLLGSLVAGGGP